MPLEAVGFDLDYTLAIPERDRGTLLGEAVDAVGAPPIGRAEYLDAHRRNLAGETREPVFDDLLDGGEADPAALAREYRERINEALVPVDGVEGLLADLRGRYRVGLLTNGPAVAQRGKLDALGWADAFDAVAISGEVGAGKPDRRAFDALLDALGGDPDGTAYVGDEVEADVLGATDAGLHAVQVIFDGGPDPHPRASAHVERAALADALPGVLESL